LNGIDTRFAVWIGIVSSATFCVSHEPRKIVGRLQSGEVLGNLIKSAFLKSKFPMWVASLIAPSIACSVLIFRKRSYVNAGMAARYVFLRLYTHDLKVE
jgi:hypothetical protein